MPSPSFRLEPLPGYAPTIGRLVGILLYARQTTLAAVEGLSIANWIICRMTPVTRLAPSWLTSRPRSVGISVSRLRSDRPLH
jgi:hypothetical protein